MLEGVIHRVEQRLKAVGLSATAASKQAGLSEDAIRNMKRAVSQGGRKGVSTETISKLAPILQTTTGWLLEGAGLEDAAGATVPLVGYVGAGDAAHFYAESDELDYVDAPPGIDTVKAAAAIRGPSLGPIFDGWLVYWGERRAGVPTAFYGKLCMVWLPDDRVLVKQIQPSRHQGFFHLISNNEAPMMDEEVVWSALVEDMRPR